MNSENRVKVFVERILPCFGKKCGSCGFRVEVIDVGAPPDICTLFGQDLRCRERCTQCLASQVPIGATLSSLLLEYTEMRNLLKTIVADTKDIGSNVCSSALLDDAEKLLGRLNEALRITPSKIMGVPPEFMWEKP